MNPDEFRDVVSEDAKNRKPTFTHVADAGRVVIKDIVKREITTFHFEDRDVQRVILYMQGRTDPLTVPLVVWGQLHDLMKEVPRLVAFKVLRTGAGKQTRYQIVPEAGVL